VVEVSPAVGVVEARDDVDDRGLVHPQRREGCLAGAPLVDPDPGQPGVAAVPVEGALGVADDEDEVVEGERGGHDAMEAQPAGQVQQGLSVC
jgi:hypothetical protein